jgi:hypothetical protein
MEEQNMWPSMGRACAYSQWEEAMTVEERIREALREAARDRGRDVANWPDDERDLYREVSCKSFTLAQEAVFELRITKAAAAIAGIVREAQAEAWESCADGYVDQLANITLDWQELNNPYRGEGA